MFIKALKPVIADIFTDNSAVFLLNEAVVVLAVVAASGKGDAVIFAPEFGGIVDKFRAIIAMKLQDGQEGRGFDTC